MTAFDLTRSARADLKAIARYTQSHWGLAQRNAYLDDMDQLFHLLAGNPSIGRSCDEIRAGYRKFPHGEHVIYYKLLAANDLLIVRILHATMDVDAHLGS
ncbi:MAG: type II toxin-antitoxin system RelE/ParE family toxin [Xanthomonadales bacterium]|nr:type II toxin-antitoxin system RelE/ParE family toxin [Xanthomonadales bacterium]MBP6078649.1 type II toxin-antitoxin system RelE/ParE family toxin [Xanthomonadales bacterium]MBP7623708.1 type II toxin-antitoxin system RelE/ParE family toxin [Xanthomonadales bacterium]